MESFFETLMQSIKGPVRATDHFLIPTIHDYPTDSRFLSVIANLA